MNDTHLQARLKVLRSGGIASDIASKFGTFLDTADDAVLFRMNPLSYAGATGMAERDAIDLFLHATRAGLLDFTWGVLCPGCVAFLTTAGGLRALDGHHRCGFCDVDVLHLVDDNVEVAFTVAPAVRSIRFHDPMALDLLIDGTRLFFSPSIDPASVFHDQVRNAVLAGLRIPAGGEAVLEHEFAAGRYILLAPASHSTSRFVAQPHGSTELSVDMLDGTAVPMHATVGLGRVRIALRNRTARPMAILFGRDPVPTAAERVGMCAPRHTMLPFLTGKRLITSETFRTLFHAESIPSDGGLELKSLTVLFTDLKGSTDLYSRVGDLRAFDLVRQHFRVLREIVAAHGGAVVKTIGDAIMASFAEPAPALQAAIAMHRALRSLEGDLQLKIGLHAGSCIAVELNDRLDYFGQTVNVAARVQGIAQANEIVCTPEVFDAPGTGEVAALAGLVAERAEVELKGVHGSTAIVRLRSGLAFRQGDHA